jgi:hypothetical protein
MMPVVLAAAPFVLTAEAIDDHSPGRSNSDFVLAGDVVDERGQPVDSVEVEIVAWVATHRSSGFADRWEQRVERTKAGPRFRLDIKGAQALDISFRRPGYRDQRVVVTYGVVRPPFVHINSQTYRPWSNREQRPPMDSAELLGGGMYYQGYDDVRPVRKEGLRIVMERPERDAAAPNVSAGR